MSKIILTFVILLAFIFSIKAQTNCENQFSADDALRWRKQMNFIPKYCTTDAIDKLILKLSERAYSQIQLEIRVKCRDNSEKKTFISNLYYFWDSRISESNLDLYFPAYYLFYQLDKSFYENSNSRTNTYPSKKKEPILKKNVNYESIKVENIFKQDVLYQNYYVLLKKFQSKNTSEFIDKNGNKAFYFEEGNCIVSFNFHPNLKCKFFRINVFNTTNRERMTTYLNTNFQRLTSVKWRNASKGYYVQLILEEEDYFIGFKKIEDCF